MHKRKIIHSLQTLISHTNIVKSLNNLKYSTKYFGTKHSDSGSETDDIHHSHNNDHHLQKKSFYEDYRMKEPRNIFDNLKEDKFEVIELIEKLREPIKVKKHSYNKLMKNEGDIQSTAEIDQRYSEFLAKCFEEITKKKYPEYKDNIEEYKDSILNYDNLNPYEKEVKTLRAYMNWKIMNKQNSKNSEIENNEFNVDNAKDQLLQKLIKINDNDTHIMVELKNKLKKLINNNKKYKDFLNSNKSNVESKLMEKTLELQKLAYIEIESLKTNKLSNLKSSLNPHIYTFSVDPHNHIEIDNWKNNSNRLSAEKDKYLAMYDIILDEYLNQTNPDNFEDNQFKYMKKSHIPLEEYHDEWADNAIFDYKCRLDNEFFLKFNSEITKFLDKCGVNNYEFNTKDKPTNRQFTEEEKTKHVADRLGWDHLSETPFDRNSFFERIDSVPIFNWQPFVQTPSINPDENLDLETGETIYEDKWIHEWVIAMKCFMLLIPILLSIFVYNYFCNGLTHSHATVSKYLPFIQPLAYPEMYPESKRMDGFLNWGTDLWHYQHWIKKFLLYPVFGLSTVIFVYIVSKSGRNRIIKASFNRSKDLLFIYRPGAFLGKRLEVVELHYFEKQLNKNPLTWKYYGYINGDIHAYSPYVDLRTSNENFLFKEDARYWNHDLKKYFDDNTSTYWKGLRSRDVDKGIIFNNSHNHSSEYEETIRNTKEEIKNAVKKYGPLQGYDYENNFNYQLKSRLNNSKFELLNYSH